MPGFRRIVRSTFKGHQFRTNPLTQDKDTAGGKNWYVDGEGHITQRPGVQLVSTFTEPVNASGTPVMTTIGETGQSSSISSFGMLGMFEFANTTSANLWVGNYSSGTPTGANAATSRATEAQYDKNAARASSELYVVSAMSAHRLTPVVIVIESNAGNMSTMRWENGVLYLRVKSSWTTSEIAQVITPTLTMASLRSTFATQFSGSYSASSNSFSQESQLAQSIFIVDGIRNSYSGTHIYAHILDEMPTAYPLGSEKVTARKAMLYPLLTNIDDSPIYAVNHNGNVYWAGRSAPLMKFNGFRTMLAGVPDLQQRGTFLTASADIAGAGLEAGTYQYKITYCTYDPSGAIHESTPLEFSHVAAGAINGIRITAPVEQSTGSLLTRAAKYASNNSRWAHYQSGAFYRNSTNLYTADGTISTDSTMFRVGETIGYWDTSSKTRKTTRIVESGVGGGSINFEPTDPPSVSTTSPTSASSTQYFEVGGTTRIYRTVKNGTAFYLVAETPFIDVASRFDDTVTDADLITREAFSDTAFVRGAPPRVTGHMCVHQSRLIVVTRQLGNENSDPSLQNTPAAYDTVAWSEVSSEYFPPENSITLPQQDADIVAVASYEDTLYVLTKTGVWTVTGDLGDALDFTVSRTNAIGCISAGSVQVLPEGVMYLSADGYVYLGKEPTADKRSVSVAPELPSNVDGFERGFRVPYDSISTDIEPLLDVKLARSAVLHEKSWYVCFIPTTYRSATFTGWSYIDSRRDEEEISGTVYGTEASKTYPGYFNFFNSETTGAEQAGGYFCVYDFANDRWYLWTNIDASGGLVSHRGELYGCNMKPGTAVWKLSDAWPADYATSGSTWTHIPFQYTTAWEDAEDPSVFKTFPRVQVYSLKDGSDDATLNVYVDRDWTESSTVAAELSVGPTNKSAFLPTTNEKCHVMRLRFESESGENTRPTLSGWSIEASGDFTNMSDD